MNSIIDNSARLQFLDSLIQLASERNRDNRSDQLLRSSNPADNEGWAFYLPSCYNAALDIQAEIKYIPPPCSLSLQTSPTKNRCTMSCKKVIWKQGVNFAFSRDDMIYNTPVGYQDWGVAMKEIQTVLQVSSASAAAPMTGELPRYPGRVEFRILRPNNDRSMLEEQQAVMLTQDEFVRYLITGEL